MAVMDPNVGSFRIRREGGLIAVTLKGRIQRVPYPQVPRLSAPGTIIGDLVDVDIKLSADEAWRVAEMLEELARQVERHVRSLVRDPQT